jgi:2-succinyl-5-enolpyruvyl-6-hydroxy-3-cyclohexene-1-carboxylate synthase
MKKEISPSRQDHLNTLASIFYRLGGTHAVICPGSRNVPIIAAFVHHKGIKCISIPDERSAGFTALGIAQQTNKPVALICTSGTAALNFYPAVCEAFYQGIPLIVITADRPQELIDQWDGQAIRQKELYRDHILDEFSITEDSSMYETEFRVSFTISLAIQQKLPVHINYPLQEPFYPSSNQEYEYDNMPIPVLPAELLPFHKTPRDTTDTGKIIQLLSRSARTLVVFGANQYPAELMQLMHETKTKTGFVVIADTLSNYTYDDAITGYDFVLGGADDELKPEALVTIGGPVLSKNLRTYLRKHKPAAHIHIGEIGHIGDPFQSLTYILRKSPADFFMALSTIRLINDEYEKLWKEKTKPTAAPAIYKAVMKAEFCEIKAAFMVFNSIPAKARVQLANSMPVRYFMHWGNAHALRVNSNRGTSGIDGCSSTAVGAALVSKELTVLVTGDIAFFYDVNAFWQNMPNNLRIVILNNRGGGIFDFVDGTESVPELKPYIQTPHQRRAKYIAEDFGLDYRCIADEENLMPALKDFFKQGKRASILEIITDQENNARIYKELKGKLTKKS